MDPVEEVVGEDYGDARLPAQNWQRRHYTKCNFRDADLSELRTESVIFTDCDFTGADLAESRHVGTAFRSCSFTRTRQAPEGPCSCVGFPGRTNRGRGQPT